MASQADIARPYAVAVFKQARDEQAGGKGKNALGHWSDMLEALKTILTDATVLGLIANPKVNNDQLCSLVLEVAGENLSPSGRNFVRVLAENGRLGALPAIADAYGALRAKAEGRSDVQITSAYELSKTQRQHIAAAMTKRLGTEVDLSVQVDESLIGGAVIRAGDLVIDASLKGRLAQLAATLN